MTQQQAMEHILKEWIRISKNLTVLSTMGLPVTMGRQLAQKNDHERILRCNGFVYRIITEQNDQYTSHFVFRKKRVRNYRKVHQNWLTRNNVIDPQSSEFTEVDITGNN